jgi:uncharacterized protein YbjT (DUF2867 family)
MMRTLVTGASGGVGAVLVPELLRRGADLRAFGRSEERARAVGLSAAVAFVAGDAVTGAGLDEALDGVEVAYFLIHSMEGGAVDFVDLERRAAEQFVEAAQRAGTRRVVYLGGPVPADKPMSRHLASRLAVEEILLGGVPEAVAFRASIVVGPRSRSFRFLVRLVERSPVLPMPPWRTNRGRPIDERDLLAYLAEAGFSEAVRGALSLDVAGPDVLTYGAMIETIRDLMIVSRPSLSLPIALTPVASRVAAAIAGEDIGLIEPLMESLESDLLPRDERVRELFGQVRLHRFEAAVERSLREWERVETLAAR